MSTPTKNAVPVSTVAVPAGTAAAPLIGGVKWGGPAGSGVALTYSFPAGTAYRDPNYSKNNEWAGWSALDATQRGAVVTALSSWSACANVTFTECADNATVVGDLRFARSTAVDAQKAAGWAYMPGNAPAAGDVWLSPTYYSGTASVAPGTHRHLILLHEIGHALGLKHSFESYGGNTARLPQALDTYHWTVMSYNAAPGDRSVTANIAPTTPMVYDIAAVQYLYGANTAWRSGDDTYVFSGTGRYLQTIWDGGGVDTIRYDSDTGGVIDLREGRFSELGQPVRFSNGTIDRKTVAIALGARIENAVGGNGDDVIYGNDLANRINGGRGADRMEGFGGDDIYIVDDMRDVVVEAAGGGIDTIRASVSYTLPDHVEIGRLTGSKHIDLTGNALDNKLYGNAGKNVLDGGRGADRMQGNGGNDIYIVDDLRDQVIEFADGGIDTVRASVSYTLPKHVENGRLTGLAALDLTGNDLANRLVGNRADNVLTGGLGADLLRGNGGNDSFRYRSPAEGGDRIEDFDAGDRILLDRLGFGVAQPPANFFAANAGGAATAAAHRVIFDTSNGSLWFDPDGNGAAAATRLATLLGVSSLAATDVVWV